MPPPSSGGVALIEMLNILEAFDLKAQGLLDAAEHCISQIEAMRRAYLDRARYLGDPDFVEVPVAKLTSKEHARTVAASIDETKASASVELGKDILDCAATEPDETTHFSVIDRDGMAVTQHIHARRRLRLARRRQGRRVPAQQRDGRLQHEAGRHQPHWRHRHAANLIAAGQADAELDDADDGRRRMARSCW